MTLCLLALPVTQTLKCKIWSNNLFLHCLRLKLYQSYTFLYNEMNGLLISKIAQSCLAITNQELLMKKSLLLLLHLNYFYNNLLLLFQFLILQLFWKDQHRLVKHLVFNTWLRLLIIMSLGLIITCIQTFKSIWDLMSQTLLLENLVFKKEFLLKL